MTTYCKTCKKDVPGSRMSFAMHCMTSKAHRKGNPDPRWKKPEHKGGIKKLDDFIP